MKFWMIYLLSYFLLTGLFLLVQYATLPDVSIWNKKQPLTTSLIEQRESMYKTSITPNKVLYHWIPFIQIPDLFLKTIVVAEDASFWLHEGIDWFEVSESMKKNLKKGQFVRGGSTITQQVAKNLYLSPDKSVSRKVREWFIARKLEKKLNKSRILELYVNIVEWGPGVFGMITACEAYFDKAPADLSLSEMVRLAAVLPNPINMRPDQVSKSVQWRSLVILNRLNRFNFISEDQFTKVTAEIDSLHSQFLQISRQ